MCPGGITHTNHHPHIDIHTPTHIMDILDDPVDILDDIQYIYGRYHPHINWVITMTRTFGVGVCVCVNEAFVVNNPPEKTTCVFLCVCVCVAGDDIERF